MDLRGEYLSNEEMLNINIEIQRIGDTYLEITLTEDTTNYVTPITAVLDSDPTVLSLDIDLSL